MTDSTVIAARRFAEQHPGYELVAAAEAAVPFSWLTLEVLAQKRKPLPALDEFVLRFCQQGVDDIAGLAGVLGMDHEAIRATVAHRLSDEHVDYRPDPHATQPGARRISLTRAGVAAVAELQTTVPERADHLQAFDRLLWAPVSRRRSELVTAADAAARGTLMLPPPRTRDVLTDEVAPRAINALLARAAKRRPRRRPRAAGPAETIEVLAVEAVIRQRLFYLPTVLLIFAAGGSAESSGIRDVRLSLVVDDELSDEHERVLTEAGGADRLGITVAPPLGEPPLPTSVTSRRAARDTVQDLQRRAIAPAPADEQRISDEDRLAAQDELDVLTVRSVPVFEHPELLASAIRTARRRFLLMTSHVRDAVLTKEMIEQLEVMLRRRGLVARIAYGLGCRDDDHDPSAIKRLRRLATTHNNLTLARLADDLPHDLIVDDHWVNTSFGWLSFRGGRDRVYRREEGTLIRVPEHVKDRHTHHAALIDTAAT